MLTCKYIMDYLYTFKKWTDWKKASFLIVSKLFPPPQVIILWGRFVEMYTKTCLLNFYTHKIAKSWRKRVSHHYIHTTLTSNSTEISWELSLLLSTMWRCCLWRALHIWWLWCRHQSKAWQITRFLKQSCSGVIGCVLDCTSLTELPCLALPAVFWPDSVHFCSSESRFSAPSADYSAPRTCTYTALSHNDTLQDKQWWGQEQVTTYNTSGSDWWAHRSCGSAPQCVNFSQTPLSSDIHSPE